MQQRSQALAHVTKHFDINGFPELRENKNRKNWKVLPKNLSTYHPMSVLDQNIGSSIGYHANEISQEALPFPSNTMSGVVGKHNFLMSKSETSGNERCLSTNRLNSVLNKSLYNSELVSSLCTRGQPAVRTPLRETAIFNDLTLVRDICALLRVDMVSRIHNLEISPFNCRSFCFFKGKLSTFAINSFLHCFKHIEIHVSTAKSD